MNDDEDADQGRHVDALVDLAWPHIEDELFNRSCLTSRHDARNIAPGPSSPPVTGQEDELFNRSCLKSQHDARNIAPDPSSPPVTGQKSYSSPPSVQGVGVHNGVGFLASSAPAAQTSSRNSIHSRQQLHTKIVYDYQKPEPYDYQKPEPLDAEKGTPRNSPRRSSMSVNSMVSQQRITSAPKPKKRQSINSGRDALLTVHYRDGEQPMADFLRLEGGLGSPVIVEAVAAGSKASCAGVQPGYALVTMNGRSEFTQLPGWQVRLLLEAPITLGFDPSFQSPRPQPGMCTEIRLKRAAQTIGVPSVVGVCGPADRGTLAEEVVFKPSAAPLFLKSGASFSESHLNVVKNCTDTTGHNTAIVYELRHNDAQTIVGRAVHGARQAVDSTFEAECVMEPALDKYQCSFRSLSPISLCNVDCVAGYDNDDSNTGVGGRTAQPKQYRLYKKGRCPESGQRGFDMDDKGVTHAAHILTAVPQLPRDVVDFQSEPWDGNTDLGSQHPVSPRSSINASPKSSVHGGSKCSKCGCGHEEDDDNWLNFHSSRSPLRFLAPVLEPVMRVFSPSRSPVRKEPEFSPRTPVDSRVSTRSAGGTTRSVGGTNVFGGLPSTKAVGSKFDPLQGDKAKSPRVVRPAQGDNAKSPRVVRPAQGDLAKSPRVVLHPSPVFSGVSTATGQSGVSTVISGVRGGNDIFSHMTRESPRPIDVDGSDIFSHITRETPRQSHSPRGMRQSSTKANPRTMGGVAQSVGVVHHPTSKRKSLSPPNRKPMGDQSAEVVDFERSRPSARSQISYSPPTAVRPKPSFDLQGRNHGRAPSGSKSPRVRSKSPTVTPYTMTPLQQIVLPHSFDRVEC